MSSSSLKTFADQIRQAESSGKIEINASSKRAIMGLLAEYEEAVGNFDADPGTYALALLALLHSDMEDKIRDAKFSRAGWIFWSSFYRSAAIKNARKEKNLAQLESWIDKPKTKPTKKRVKK